MWLSSRFGNIASSRSFQLGIIILYGLILTNCATVTFRQLGTENLQNLQQITVQDMSGREGQLALAPRHVLHRNLLQILQVFGAKLAKGYSGTIG